MFQDLECVLPEGCADHLGRGRYVDSSFCHALSILESDGVVSGSSMVVLRCRDLPVRQEMSHVAFSRNGERATLTALVRTKICRCNLLGPVPLKVEFARNLTNMFTQDVLPRKRKQSTTIRIQCFHCAAMRAVVVSSARLLAIPRQPRATLYVGALAVRAVGYSADRTRFNCHNFKGPVYHLPTTVEISPRPPDDLTTYAPDLCSLLVWNRIRNVALGPEATSKFWRTVSNAVLVSSHGATGPWTVQLTHVSSVRVRATVHREGSDLLLTWHGEQHIRIPARKDELPLSATCIEELAGWHVAAIKQNVDQEDATVHVKMEES
jgi:hypothetical protein